MVKTIVVTGIHNAGKTTVVNALSSNPNLRVFTELGGELRSRAACSSWNSCEVFDELIMLREFERDPKLLDYPEGTNGIVLEQWHIGNLAHARVRAPRVADEYEARLASYLKVWPLQLEILHLQISVDEMLRRERNVPEDVELFLDFYDQLNVETMNIMQQWSLRNIVLNAEQSSEVVVAEAWERLLHTQ